MDRQAQCGECRRWLPEGEVRELKAGVDVQVWDADLREHAKYSYPLRVAVCDKCVRTAGVRVVGGPTQAKMEIELNPDGIVFKSSTQGIYTWHPYHGITPLSAAERSYRDATARLYEQNVRLVREMAEQHRRTTDLIRQVCDHQKGGDDGRQGA